ncbi:MAG: hypothetical protein ACK47E_04830 [Cyclobacteriaceae bacterium]
MNKFWWLDLYKNSISMKAVKNFLPLVHFNSIKLQLATTLLGALMIAMAIGTVVVMIVSRF